MKNVPISTSLKALLISSAFLAVALPLHATNLIVNGSFETNAVAFPNGDGKGAVDQNNIGGVINNWKVVSPHQLAVYKNPTLVDRGPLGFAEDGLYHVNLGGTNQGDSAITQSIKTTVGRTYKITWFMGSIPQYNSGLQGPAILQVQAGTVMSQVFSYKTDSDTGYDAVWKSFSTTFVANATTTAITFYGVQSSAYIGLDLVSVEETTATDQLLLDGDFESGFFGATNGDGMVIVNPSNTPNHFNSWEVLHGEVDWFYKSNTYVGPAASGEYSISLREMGKLGPPGAVSRTVFTKVGTPYLLTFSLGVVPDTTKGFNGPASVWVNVGGQAQLFTCDSGKATGTKAVWKSFSYVFTATAPVTPIIFQGSYSTGLKYIGLDNVSLTVSDTAPEPVFPNLVVNGDFEDASTFVPNSTLDYTMILPVGSTDLPGWTVTSAPLPWFSNHNPYGAQAGAGFYSVGLTNGGFNAGAPYAGLSQKIVTKPGDSYVVKFLLATIPNRTNGRQPVSVKVAAGDQSEIFTSDVNKAVLSGTTGDVAYWTLYSYVFTADSTQTTLSFTGIATSGDYIGLDHISMIDQSQPLPAPPFSNGSFEAGSFADNGAGGMFLSKGSTVLTGWTTTNGTVTWEKNTNTIGVKSKAGYYSLNLVGFLSDAPFGGVTQNVPTFPGQYYQLTYFIGGQPTGDQAGPVGVTVKAGNSSITDNFDPTGTVGATTTVWQKFTFIFKATSDSTPVSFTGNSSAGGYIGLDAISIDAINLQTISFPVPATAMVGQTISLNAVASSGLPVTYSIVSTTGNPNIGTNARLSGNQLSITGVGVVKLIASQAGTSSYAAAATVSSPQGIAVSKGTQTITSWVPVDAPTYGDDPIALDFPVASSGLPVTVKVTLGTGVARISGKSLIITGAGAVTLSASQAGNANYSASPTVTTSFVVGKKAQNVKFSAVPQPAAVGTTARLQAVSDTKTAITFRVVSGPGSISGNVLTFTGQGTITLEADQAETAVYLPSASPQIKTTGRSF